jgi:hypothetical protein
VLRAAELIAGNRTQSVRIISDGPSIEGEIRWISRTRAGVKFDHPINLAELNAPLAKAV